MDNPHLVPDLIQDLVARYLKANRQNEKFLLEDRLKAIVTFIQDGLNNRSNVFKKRN